MTNRKMTTMIFVIACLCYCVLAEKSDKCFGVWDVKKSCDFPFIHNGTEYNSCTNEYGGEQHKFWCAVSVDENSRVEEWLPCEDPKCNDDNFVKLDTDLTTQRSPKEKEDKLWGTAVVVGILVGVLFLITLFGVIGCKYMKKKKDEKKLKSMSTARQVISNEMTEGTNMQEMNAMNLNITTANETEIVLERQTSPMNAYKEESEIVLEKQRRTIKDGDPSKINPETFLNEQASLLPYTGKCEIDRSKFEINQLLGGGNFGNVFEGETNDLVHPEQRIKVAIKMVNNSLDLSQLSVLMGEIKILDKLDVHLNLVNMIGACTTQIKDGKLWLLLEYCPQSDMKRFLLKNRETIQKDLKNKTTPNSTFERLFIQWAHGVAKGMEYLFTKRIMHGDLAARNILIGKHGETETSYVAKITDFGLSRAFYDQSTYTKQEREKIPWKWMDISFLQTGQFTMSSDVWSFGIVLWEMLSLGRLPYAGENVKDTIRVINSGYRLSVPEEIIRVKELVEIYEKVAKMCLVLNPKERWTFTDLVDYFETYLTSEEKKEYKRLEDKYIEMQNIINIDSNITI